MESTFVAVMEPFGNMSAIKTVRRLPMHKADGAEAPDTAVAVEVKTIDGGQDLIVAADPAIAGALVQKDWDATLTGELCLVRRDKNGKAVHVALANGVRVNVGSPVVECDAPGTLREWHREAGKE